MKQAQALANCSPISPSNYVDTNVTVNASNKDRSYEFENQIADVSHDVILGFVAVMPKGVFELG